MQDSDSSDVQEGRLVRTARTMASLARRLRTGVAILTGTSVGAGLLLWGLLWWPVPMRPLSLVGAGGTLLLLLAPAAVLGLFYQGLHDLLVLPDRLSERTARTAEQSADAVQTATTRASAGLLGRLWGLVRQIWALRTVLSENRALLLRYGTLIRFVTPAFLLLVILSASVSLLLVPIAAVGGLVVLLW